MTVASGLHAQRPTKDKEKARQWQSMENGPWDFAPDWYYFLLHKKYSGAEMYWKWAGFQSGFRVRFKEHKSNVKRIMPTRVTAEETQRQKIKKVEEERQKMEELYQEELLREADRNVDLMFPSYKDEFNRMQDCITDGLLYCMQQKQQVREGKPIELNVGGEKVSVGVDLKEPQGFKVIQGDMKEWVRQQKLRYDEQHPEFLGLVMTDKNRWEYQQVVDKQSQERALKLHAPKAEQSKGLKL